MNAVNIPLIDPAMNIELPVTHSDDSGKQRAGALLGAREWQLIVVLIHCEVRSTIEADQLQG